MRATRKDIYDALRGVQDTCSVFNGTNLDIVEMGLVDGIEQEGGIVRVRLLLTDPMCLYQFEMRAQIIEALTGLPGIDVVHVEPVAGKLWSPDNLAPPAKARLEILRRERFERLRTRAPLAAGARNNTPA